MPLTSRSQTTTDLLPNPHPGEILKEEFLLPMGLSQNALARAVKVPPRRGFALRDAIISSQPHGGTYLGKAVTEVDRRADRLIVFTDEQSHDQVANPKGRGYMVNVASYQHGVGHGAWTRVDGFSEAVIAWIATSEETMH